MSQPLAYSHQRVRRVRRLLHKRVARWAEHVFVAEGVELVRAALAAGAPVESVYVGAEGAGDPMVADLAAKAADRGIRVHDLAPGVLARVADTVTPQPLLAVVGMVDRPPAALAGGRLVVVLAEVRDPGNAGTVLRSADAAGADGVVFAGSTVDPYNPKTVRSSAGSIFHVPLVVCPPRQDVLSVVAGYRRLGAVVRGGTDYTDVDWLVPTALVLGNESAGLDAALAERLDGTVGIPMAGLAESLNVGVASAVLCFEALRQRRAAGGVGSSMPGMPGGNR